MCSFVCEPVSLLTDLPPPYTHTQAKQELAAEKARTQEAISERDGLRENVLRLREDVAAFTHKFSEFQLHSSSKLKNMQSAMEAAIAKVLIVWAVSGQHELRCIVCLQLGGIIGEEVAAHCATGNLSRLIKVSSQHRRERAHHCKSWIYVLLCRRPS